MPKTKIAVIGVGHLGSRHAAIYQKIPGCSLVALCDTNLKRLSSISAQLGVPAVSDYRQLLNRVEAVSIAVPTQRHYQIADDFLQHGVHVLLEKPFTANLKQADSLIKTAQKKKLILQIGHLERFNSAFSATKKLIKNPKFIECHRLSPFPGRSLDIGAVLDIMIHDIDIILGLIPSKIKKIEAVGVNVLTAFEDIANARITFSSGCVANLTASRVSDETMRKIRIFQENTYISLDYKEAAASIYKKEGSSISKIDLPIEKEQPLEKELESFIDCITSRKTPLVSGQVAREALAVALKIQQLIWPKNKS